MMCRFVDIRPKPRSENAISWWLPEESVPPPKPPERGMETHRPHIQPYLADYAAGTLESRCLQELEAHVLVCDVCFAALVAQVLFGPTNEEESAPA